MVARFDALNELDFDGSNNGMDVSQPMHSVDATQRSEEPVSITILNVCALDDRKSGFALVAKVSDRRFNGGIASVVSTITMMNTLTASQSPLTLRNSHLFSEDREKK